MKEELLKDVPMIDLNKPNDLKFNLWSTQSNSDYDNSRDRPYNGQPWAGNGIRGKTEVKRLTMRDIQDCIIKAFLVSCPDDEYLKRNEFEKCWDFQNCKTDTDKPKPTEYLIAKQKEGKFLSTKVDTGTWRPQDLYLLDMSNLDPCAVVQNTLCEIERMMGIYPNITDSTL